MGTRFYTRVYHELFSGQRDRPIRLLEIGVGGYDLRTAGGACILAIWGGLLSQRANYRDRRCQKNGWALNPRIKVFQGSQDDPSFPQEGVRQSTILLTLSSTMAVVSEAGRGQLKIFCYVEFVIGGTYVIEDMQTAFWPRFGGWIFTAATPSNYADANRMPESRRDRGCRDQSHSFPPFAKQIKSFRAFHNIFVIEKRG